MRRLFHLAFVACRQIGEAFGSIPEEHSGTRSKVYVVFIADEMLRLLMLGASADT